MSALVHVVTCSDRTPTESYYHPDKFFESLRRLGVEAVNLGPRRKWAGLMTKLFLLRDWLREGGAKAPFLIVCDAWDVCFMESPDSIVERYKQLWPDEPIIFNAERSCWPRGDLTEKFPISDTPFNFPNTGWYIGKPNNILTMIESANIDEIGMDRVNEDGSKTEPNDQGVLQEVFTKQPVPMKVDHRAELCLCAHGTKPEELNFSESRQRIKCCITGTFPGAIHLNGSAKGDLGPAVFAQLGL